MVVMERNQRRAITGKVRHALELIGLEDAATDAVTALGIRGLVVIEREKLVDPEWLSERLEVLRTGAQMRPYESEQPSS